MKIGILTLPLHTNYGGILQAYALQTTIERMGHEAYLLSIKRSCILQITLFPIIICNLIYRKLIKHVSYRF